jgi:serine/threonine-protein kinase
MIKQVGPYKLERLIGRGGMGAVYAARHETTRETVAVKLLSGHLAEDPTFRERFQQEIETLKRLLHPNIVQLYGFGEEQGQLYYVMELIDGHSLQDELLNGRRFDWREVTRIGIAVAQALKHAHDRGIIHRDLKPANLLIDAQDHVKLADFGIAKLYGGTSVTAEGGMLGTADYMAPEQAAGKPATNRCDLYSLGSVMYALLAGRPPFSAATMVEVIAALQNESAPSARQLAPETPAELDRIVLQLLEKDPNKRIPTALALANCLQAMEHALSLDTRVMQPEHWLNDAELAPVKIAPRKTEAIDFGSQPTTPLAQSDGDEYRLEAMDISAGTQADQGGKQSGRTELSTQAGKKTGNIRLSGRGTDVVQRAAEPAAESIGGTTTPFIAVSNEERRGPRDVEDAPLKQWMLAGALALAGLAIVGSSLYFATRPPSANRLYAGIKAAADRGGAAELLPVEGEITRFLQLYSGDARAAELKNYLGEIDQYRLERRLQPGRQRSRRREALAPVERAYQEAVQLEESDPEAAIERLEALAAVFGGTNDSDLSDPARRATAMCLDLARQEIARLKPEVESLTADHRAAVERQLNRADSLAKSDRASAEQIWRGIVTLYDDKRWANELVAAAKGKLAQRGVEGSGATAEPK